MSKTLTKVLQAQAEIVVRLSFLATFKQGHTEIAMDFRVLWGEV